jgi:putative FmdB family regulatory protein
MRGPADPLQGCKPPEELLMPIYEYKCAECGHVLEAIQKMSDDPLTQCPECSKPALQRLLSAAGFQLKGTGWYATDFKNSGKKKEPKKTSPEGTPGSSGSAVSSDASGTSGSSEPSGPAPEKKAQASGGGDGGCA